MIYILNVYHHAKKRLTPYAGSFGLECGVIFQNLEHDEHDEHEHERSAIPSEYPPLSSNERSYNTQG